MGNKPIIHKWASLKSVTQFKVIKKNADAEPDKTPIRRQIIIHLKKLETEKEVFMIADK
jgi:hypothetical protein